MLKKINYFNDPEEELNNMKKKLLKKQSEEAVPTTEEIDTEIYGNKPARSKEQMDKFRDNEDKRDDQIYKPQIISGSYDIKTPEIKENASTGSKVTDGLLAGAGGLMDMTATVMAQKGPMNKQQRKANTMNMASKGMSTGASIGGAFGPQGALIGAGVGLVAGAAKGLIQGIGHQKELDAIAKAEKIAMLNEVKTDRENAQKLSDGKKAIEKRKNILKAQAGMLGSSYS